MLGPNAVSSDNPNPSADMKLISWHDSLSIGVPELDDQHRQLIAICNRAIAGFADREGLRAVLSELREYTVKHFAAEEAHLDGIGYPQRAAHAQIHARLKREVMDYQDALYRRRSVTSAELRAFLKKWLIDHILHADMAFQRYAEERERERRARENALVLEGGGEGGGNGENAEDDTHAAE